MPSPLHDASDDSGWRISDHARDRAAELGFDLLTIAAVAASPILSYPQPWRGEGCAVLSGGTFALGVHVPSRTVVTVLRRRTDRWEHDPERRRPVPARVAARETTAVTVRERDPDLRARGLRARPDLGLADARRMLDEGYALAQVVRLTGYDADVIAPDEVAS